MDPIDWLNEPYEGALPFPDHMIPEAPRPTRLQVMAAIIFKNKGQFVIDRVGVFESGCPIYDRMYGLTAEQAQLFVGMGSYLMGMYRALDQKPTSFERALEREWLRVDNLRPAAERAADVMRLSGDPKVPDHAKGASVDRHCRVCGCTDARACPGGCTWVEADLCSKCVGRAASRLQ